MGFQPIVNVPTSRTSCREPAIYLNYKGSSTINKSFFRELGIKAGESFGINFLYDKEENIFGIQIFDAENEKHKKACWIDGVSSVKVTTSSCTVTIHTKSILRSANVKLKSNEEIQAVNLGASNKAICEIVIDNSGKPDAIHTFKIDRKYLCESDTPPKKKSKAGRKGTKTSKKKISQK